MDYYLQHEHNCCLVNLEDMLQNGTVISEVMIDKPHSFSTACTIATQIIAQVASFQYGGQSISLTHLAPFVDVSRQAIRKEEIFTLYKLFKSMNSIDELGLNDIEDKVDDNQKTDDMLDYIMHCMPSDEAMHALEESINETVTRRLKKEIAKGIQTIQYQIITLIKSLSTLNLFNCWKHLLSSRYQSVTILEIESISSEAFLMNERSETIESVA